MSAFRMVYLECKEGSSDKFYEVLQRNTKVSVRYGRIGADGASTEKSFPTVAEASKFVDTMAAEKRKKGYSDANADGSSVIEAPEPKVKNTKRKAVEIEPEEDEEADVVLNDTKQPLIYMTCKEGGSDKFYEIVQTNNELRIRYGRCGSDGVIIIKNYATAAETKTNITKLVNEKLKKGYKHAAAAPVPAGHEVTVKTEYKTVTVVKAPAVAVGAITTYLTCKEGGSDKFYEMIQCGSTVTTRYGRTGAAGMSGTKEFASASAASDFVARTIREKEHKKYKLQKTAPAAPAHAVVKEEEGEDDQDFDDHSYVSENDNNDNVVDDSDAADEDYDDEEVTVPSPKKRAKVTTSAATKAATTAKAPAAKTSTAASNNSSSSSSGSGEKKTTYLTFQEGNSDKFYELIQQNCKVSVRYGRTGAGGVASIKDFATDAEATKFVEKTTREKTNKGYVHSVPDADANDYDAFENNNTGSAGKATGAAPQSSGNDLEDLENGLKIFVQGSSALPYMLKKFDGGYKCSCRGWIGSIRIKGVQAATCKHLKQVRGEEAEAERCELNAGIVKNPSGKKNTSIPSKISLAQAWKTSIDPTGYIMSEKLDGMRAYWDGKKLYSRAGNPVVAPEWFIEHLPADMHLDGELFLGRKLFDECMSITRRTDAGDGWNKICYVVFDAPNSKGGILKRLEAATAALEKTDNIYARVHPQEVCRDTEHLLEELSKIEKLDGEGLMLRKPDAAHRGGRSSDLLKVKSFQDDEALIIDYEAGNGKYTGQIGSLVCILRNGSKFKCGSGLTDVQRDRKNAPKIGTVITVKFFELTTDGIPRFPTFLRIRPDVAADEFPSKW